MATDDNDDNGSLGKSDAQVLSRLLFSARLKWRR